MTSSNGNIFRVTGHLCGGIHRSPVNSSHKGQWRSALMFSLICAWINGWIKNGEAGDLRRHRVHYNVAVMSYNWVAPDSKVHGANMGPTWVLSAPGGPHVGLINFAIWGIIAWPSRTRYWIQGCCDPNRTGNVQQGSYIGCLSLVFGGNWVCYNNTTLYMMQIYEGLVDYWPGYVLYYGRFESRISGVALNERKVVSTSQLQIWSLPFL